MNSDLSKDRSSCPWELVPLGKLGRWSGGGTPSKSRTEYWEEGTIPWVSPKDMKGQVIRGSQVHITEAAVADSATKLIPPGSVLFVTRSGILRHSFPVAINVVTVTVNQDLKVLTPRSGVLPDYVTWALRAFSQEILNTCSKQGTTVNSIETKKLKEYEIPVAPYNQQKRIVAEIEKQFSRLDEAVAGLKRVQANLKRYRAALLKAAVEGRLVETEAERARREGRDYETGAQLLQRILDERRRKWEAAELEKMTARGKPPKNDKWKARYKQPAAPDTDYLPELPEGWVWTSFLAVSEKVTVGHVGSMKNEYVEEGIPFLRSQNVRPNYYDPKGLKFIGQRFHDKLAKSSLNPGDVVIVRSGAVGVSCVIPDELKKANCSDLVIVKRPIFTSPKFVSFYMNAIVDTRVAKGKVGVALVHFNTKSVAQLPLPLPPLPEQHRIVTELDRRLSILRKAEAQVAANLKRAEALRQSILAAAFSGRLVPEPEAGEAVSAA